MHSTDFSCSEYMNFNKGIQTSVKRHTHLVLVDVAPGR